MPVEERSTRSVERCDQHPGRPSVAICEGCGRPLCVVCALPVRGSVFGLECLPDGLVPEPLPPPPRTTPLDTLTGIALLATLAATLLPWSRFGVGSGLAGAWGRPLRWSSVVVVAALLGCLAWLSRRTLGLRWRWLDLAVTALAGLAFVGASASMWHPPAFTRGWVGSWIAAASAGVATAASFLDRRRARRAQPPPI